jgi:hypothetical protein
MTRIRILSEIDISSPCIDSISILNFCYQVMLEAPLVRLDRGIESGEQLGRILPDQQHRTQWILC